MAIGKTSGDASQHRPMTAESLRELVLQAGVEVLVRDGLMLRPESISYAKVFAYLDEEYGVRVTRGSVHERIWSGHDDFRRDVLAQALQHLPLDVPVRTELGRLPVMLDVVDALLGSDQPTAAFARGMGSVLWTRSAESPIFASIQSLKAIASRFNDPVTAEVLSEELRKRDDVRRAARPQVISAAVDRLGGRFRPSLGLSREEGAALMYELYDTLLIGGHLTSRARCCDLAEPVPGYQPAPDDDQPWLVCSVAFHTFLDSLTEPLPPGVEPTPVDEAEELAITTEGAPVAEIDLTTKTGQRRSREELRRLVLAAGQELLLRDGLALQPEALRYSTVLAHIKDTHGLVVNRASIHGRIWPTHYDFCLDVLARSIEHGPLEWGYGIYRVGDDLEIMPDPGDERRRAAHEALRMWALKQVDRFSDSPHYRQRLLVMASLLDKAGSPAMDNLCEVIQRTNADRLRWGRQLAADMLDDLGYEVRPERGISTAQALDLMASISQAVLIGHVFNRLSGVVDGTKRYSLRRVGSGERDDWNLVGVATRTLFDHFFSEPAG